MSRLVRAARVSDAASMAAVNSAASPGYAELIQRNAGMAYVAEEAGSIVGYLLLRNEAHPAVESRNPVQLWQLYVIPAFHGSGIAAQLMAAALEFARKHLHDVIWLGVSEHNPRAIAFYRKHGFNLLGLHRIGAGDHEHEDILMSCLVS